MPPSSQRCMASKTSKMFLVQLHSGCTSIFDVVVPPPRKMFRMYVLKYELFEKFFTQKVSARKNSQLR